MRIATILVSAVVAVAVCHATSVDSSISLKDMFEKADLVAVVEITAADSESFDTWMYRARVEAPIKNAGKDQVIYFGSAEPHQDGENTSYRLRGEYVVFLRYSTKSLDEHRSSRAGPWKEDGRFTYYIEVCGNKTVLPLEVIWDGTQWEWRVGLYRSCFRLPEQLDTITLEESAMSLPTESWVSKQELLDLLRRYGAPE